MAETNGTGSGKSEAQLDSEHFSPYRADGKLVRCAKDDAEKGIALT